MTYKLFNLILIVIIVIIMFAFLRYVANLIGINCNEKPPIKPDDPTSPLIDTKPPPKEKKESKGEKACRKFMEDYYGVEFKNTRPSFLVNPKTKRKLELDVYNEELKIAVEYNGIQHYEYTPYFHKSKEDFENQKYRDKIKAKLCKQNGIHLIVVKYDVPIDEIPEYLSKNQPKSTFIGNIFSPKK